MIVKTRVSSCVCNVFDKHEQAHNKLLKSFIAIFYNIIVQYIRVIVTMNASNPEIAFDET